MQNCEALHIVLYHYAGNNPVKYTDPDGRETDDTLEGKLIHALITLEYQTAHKDDIVYGNKAMSTSMCEMGLVDKGLGKTDLGVRPDIWNVTTNEMYEIKPATQGADVAQDQLISYIVLAGKYGLSGVKAGSSDAPGTSGNLLLSEFGISVTYWSPSPGVILYSKNHLTKPQLNFNLDFETNPCTSIVFTILGLGLMGLTGIPVP